MVGGRREKVRERSGHEYKPEISGRQRRKKKEDVREKRDEKNEGFELIT